MGRGAVFAVAVAWAGALAAGCASPSRGESYGQAVQDAARVAGDRAVYRRYHGKYTGDPRFFAGMDRIEAALPLAEERVRRRLGVPALEFPPFAVCFVDGEGSGASGSMETCLVAAGWRPVCVVAVIAEDLVTGLYEPERVLAHELTHILHISQAQGAAEPLWIAEGIAHWVEIEDEESRREFLLPSILHDARSKQVPISEILQDETVLERREEAHQDVAGAVVFFQLEWSRGTEAVRKLILRLLREKDWRAVLREETGRPLDAMFKEVRAGYLEWAPKAYPGYEELNRLDEGEPAEALAALDASIAAHPSGPVRTMAEYLRGQCLLAAGDHEGGLEALRAYRRDHPRDSLARLTLLQEVEVLRELEDWNGVAALCRGLLQDYLWSANAADWRKHIEERLEEAVGRIRSGDGGPGVARKRE